MPISPVGWIDAPVRAEYGEAEGAGKLETTLGVA